MLIDILLFLISYEKLTVSPNCLLFTQKLKMINAKLLNPPHLQVMKKTCNLQELQYTFHPPSTNTYTKYSKDEHIKTCKSKLGAILKELNIVLSQLEYVYTPSED